MSTTRPALVTLLCLALAGCHSGADPADEPTPSKAGKAASSAGKAAAESGKKPSRTFHVRYEAYVRKAPRGKQLKIWIPVPTDDDVQKISNMVIKGVPDSLGYRYTREADYGNRFLFIEGSAPAEDFTVAIEFDVARYPYRVDLARYNVDKQAEGQAFAKYLRPTKLVVINDRIRKLAARLSKGKKTRLEQARAFYDHIINEMTYGKPSDKPWGRGDTMYACDARIGNCTDFHSYFISLCRAEKIPARFQIGLFGKYDTRPGTEYKTGGYHCWAEFHIAGRGWVPVDISEADKRVSKGTAKGDVFFGYHTDNRVTLSTGRDLWLAPRQSGPPLNFIIHPYAEVEGKPFKVAKQGFWIDSPTE